MAAAVTTPATSAPATAKAAATAGPSGPGVADGLPGTDKWLYGRTDWHVDDDDVLTLGELTFRISPASATAVRGIAAAARLGDDSPAPTAGLDRDVLRCLVLLGILVPA